MHRRRLLLEKVDTCSLDVFLKICALTGILNTFDVSQLLSHTFPSLHFAQSHTFAIIATQEHIFAGAKKHIYKMANEKFSCYFCVLHSLVFPFSIGRRTSFGNEHIESFSVEASEKLLLLLQ